MKWELSRTWGWRGNCHVSGRVCVWSHGETLSESRSRSPAKVNFSAIFCSYRYYRDTCGISRPHCPLYSLVRARPLATGLPSTSLRIMARSTRSITIYVSALLFMRSEYFLLPLTSDVHRLSTDNWQWVQPHVICLNLIACLLDNVLYILCR